MTRSDHLKLETTCWICTQPFTRTIAAAKTSRRICKDCNRKQTRKYRESSNETSGEEAETDHQQMLSQARSNLEGYFAEQNKWRLSELFPGYAVSADGRVMRVVPSIGYPAGYMLTAYLTKGTEYLRVTLTIAGVTKNYPLNRLVCIFHHGLPPSPAHEAAHNDGNARNNVAANLRWATPAENTLDKFKHGTVYRGERHTFAKLSAKDVLAIRSLPHTKSLVTELAGRYAVDKKTIRAVRTRKSWSHVN